MTNIENQQKKNIKQLFRQYGQLTCYQDYLMADPEQQQYIEHVLTTMDNKGYMPA